MKIKDKLLDTTYQHIQTYEALSAQPAIFHYTGFVYKKLNLTAYDHNQWNYISDHLYIFSALYGLLHPFTHIKPYRLDLTMTIPNVPQLVSFWKESINDILKEEELIVNLASQEFSQLVDRPMVTIEFLQLKNGTFKNIATYSKQARGLMLDYMIQEKVTSLEALKQFNRDNYQYSHERSTKDKLVFIR